MHANERGEYKTIIQTLAATFSREATEALLTGYWLGLQDVDLAAVKKGAVAAMHNSRFMPTVAELRELAGEVAPATRAAIAWEKCCEAMRLYGYIPTVALDDPVATATIRNLWRTWNGFSDALDVDETKWLRKDFERVYIALCHTTLSPDQCAPLPGATALSFDSRWAGTEREVNPRVVQAAVGLPALPGHKPVPALPASRKALPDYSNVLKGVEAR